MPIARVFWTLPPIALALILLGGDPILHAFRGNGAQLVFLPAQENGPLDGMTFRGMLGPKGRPKDVADTFVFESGNFVSLECELRCDFPAKPYIAEPTEAGWRFESLTKCPSKDATIHWRGTVIGDRVSGVATWTMRRWYWTIERDFTFDAERATLQADGGA